VAEQPLRCWAFLNALKAEVDGHRMKTFPLKQTTLGNFSVLNKYGTKRQLDHFTPLGLFSCGFRKIGRTDYQIQNRLDPAWMYKPESTA